MGAWASGWGWGWGARALMHHDVWRWGGWGGGAGGGSQKARAVGCAPRRVIALKKELHSSELCGACSTLWAAGRRWSERPLVAAGSQTPRLVLYKAHSSVHNVEGYSFGFNWSPPLAAAAAGRHTTMARHRGAPPPPPQAAHAAPQHPDRFCGAPLHRFSSLD